MNEGRMLAASVYLVASLLVWVTISALFRNLSLPVGYGVASAVCAAALGIRFGPGILVRLRENTRWWPAFRAGLWVLPVAFLAGGFLYGLVVVASGTDPGSLLEPFTFLALAVQALDAFVSTIPALVPLSMLAGWVLYRLEKARGRS